jgi:hypothetical protein
MLANVLYNIKHQIGEYKIRNFHADCFTNNQLEIFLIFTMGKGISPFERLFFIPPSTTHKK